MKNKLSTDILKITRELYDSYSFLEIPKEEFLSMMKEVVKSYMSSKQARRSEKPVVFFQKCFEYELHVYIGKMMTSKEKALELINHYIKNFCPKGEYINRFKTFAQFLGDTNYMVDTAFCTYIIENCKLLQNILQFIVGSKSLEENQEYIARDPIMENLLRAYCMMNHIPFETVIKNSIESSKKQNLGALDIVTLYLNDINNMTDTKALTHADERRLGFHVLKGDQKAKKELIESNLKLVMEIAKNFPETSLRYSDLIQEGNIALIKAVETFDITQGFWFRTYVAKCIKRTIASALFQKSRLIRFPDDWAPKLREYDDFCENYKVKFGKAPTTEVVVQNLEFSKSMLKSIQKGSWFDFIGINQIMHHTDTELGGSNSLSNDDIENFIQHMSLTTDLEYVLSHCAFSVREIEIADFYYGQGLSLDEIIAILGISEQRVSQLIDQLIDRFRSSEVTEILTDYADDPDAMKRLLQMHQAKKKNNENGIEKVNVKWVKLFGSLLTQIFTIMKQLDHHSNQKLMSTMNQLLSDFERLLSDCGIADHEREFIRMHYFNEFGNMPFTTIGELYGMDNKHISAIVNRAFRKLELPENAEKISAYTIYYEAQIRMLEAYRRYYQSHLSGKMMTYEEFLNSNPSCDTTFFGKMLLKK